MTRPVTTTSAPAQALGDAEAAEVRVRGEAAGVAGGEVVALDVGDADGDTEAVRQLPYGSRESGRAEPARVGDDPDALLVGEAQGVLELAQERAGVPGGGSFSRSRARISMVSSAR